MDIRGHLRTISEHRKLVRQGCFRIGLFYQGITHDLSKYSPDEFLVGIRYYQGTESPNNAERKKKGYSAAWLHHKGKNKHHFEYWLDYGTRVKGYCPVRMPNKYIAEMYMDRVAASKTYNGEKYTNEYPLMYYEKGKNFTMIEEETRKELVKLLTMLAQKGEEATEEYIRRELLKGYPTAMLCEVIVKLKNKYDKKKNQRNT